MLGSLADIAAAADLTPPPPAPAPPPEIYQPFQVQLLAAGVIPTSGGILQASGGILPSGTLISGGFKASDAVIAELNLSYYFTKNFAVQLMCCVSYHKLYLAGGSVAPNQQAASTWLFPPTVTLQYHWTNFGQFQPYIGVGVNYTVFFSQHATEPLLNTVAVQNSWGVAGQVGFDYMLNENWGLSFDVKKIMMNPHVYGTVAPGLVSISGQANLSPWIIGGGITYRFGAPAAPVVAKY
jgi:outer membrane protein W